MNILVDDLFLQDYQFSLHLFVYSGKKIATNYLNMGPNRKMMSQCASYYYTEEQHEKHSSSISHYENVVAR